MPSQSSFTMPFFGMWQIVQKYLNTEQDTFSEKISLLERRNLVQKSIFSLIICINRNADTSNNLLGFLCITLRWQPFAQCPEKYFKYFKAAAFGDLSPRLRRWSSSRHLAFNHWAPLTAFASFSFNHTLKKGSHLLTHCFRKGEGKKEHSWPSLEGLFYKISFVRLRVNGRVKTSMDATLILHQEPITPSVWLHFG